MNRYVANSHELYLVLHCKLDSLEVGAECVEPDNDVLHLRAELSVAHHRVGRVRQSIRHLFVHLTVRAAQLE